MEQVGVNVLKDAVSTTCHVGSGTGFVWEKVFAYPRSTAVGSSGYVDFSFGSDMKPVAAAQLPHTAAVWLLNNGDECSIESALTSTGSVDIFEGWNMVAVQPNWKGKDLRELGNCGGTWEVAYFFDARTGYKVFKPDPGLNFDERSIGRGFWISTAKDCILYDASGTSRADAQNLVLKLSQVNKGYLTTEGKLSSDAKPLQDGSEILSGDTIYINPYIERGGDKELSLQGDGRTPITGIVRVYKEQGSGKRELLQSQIVTQFTLDKTTLNDLNNGLALSVIPAATDSFYKRFIKVPDDFSGKLVISAAFDTQNVYPESNERDNEASITLNVELSKPNLIVGKKVDVIPAKLSLPATLTGAIITITNIGTAAAVPNNFMVSKVSILKDSKEICSASRSDLNTIAAGTKLDLMMSNLNSVTGMPCLLTDKTATYEIVGNADLTNVIAEIYETDNSLKEDLEVS